MFAASFNLSRLRDGLKPFRLHWYPRLGSTNDHAADLRRRGELYAPAVVLTGHQLAGRGRGSNTWWSGAGCLTVTFVFAIDDALAPHQIPLLAGLAVREATAGLAGGADVQLKWPNDLLVGGRKLAGLLCERVHKADLIGLGLNVNPDRRAIPARLRDRVTSLAEVVGKPLDMTEALVRIASSLHRTMRRRADRPFSQRLREYDRHHALVGRRVSVIVGNGEPPVSGTCEGLDTLGRLLVRRGAKVHHVIAGHVVMARD
ncbi:MAG: biotin--[acetyl-CoA-carboxylase] ligase [Tepidisphaeraceae bacterium]